MADRQIKVDMLSVDDGSPVELVLGNPVSRVYSEPAQNNEVTFNIPDTILKLGLGEVNISITVSSGGFTDTKSYVIHAIEGSDVIDVDASYDSLVILKSGDIVQTIEAGSDHTIYIDWIDGDNNYVGQRDTRYIAPTVDIGSIEFLSNSGVTNIYRYTPPDDTSSQSDVTFTWGRYNDYTEDESTMISRTITLTDAVLEQPVLLNEGRTLNGSTDTITWRDDSGIPGRRYDLFINGVDQGQSVVYPATSWTVSNLPTDGSSVNVELKWWDNDDLSLMKSTTAVMIAYSAPAGTGSQFIIPSSDVPEGQYNSVDWAAGIGSLSSIFWESNGDSVTSIGDVAGRRAMTVRLDNSRTPSTRVGAGANLTPSDTATLEQWVYFDPSFDWGGSNEGGKLGFGLGGGSRPAGGLTKQDGFTARFMWRTNGSIYAYVYDGSTSGYGDDYSTGYTATKGQWFHLKMEVGMNSTGGAADGTLKVWVNESLTINRTNMEWFGTGTPQVDSLLHFTFHGGNDSTWSPSNTSYVSYSGIYWSNETAGNTFELLSPANGFVATSPDVYFEWRDPSLPNAAYDLHVYSDAERTQKVYGTNGIIFDTDHIGATTSYTFTDDPSDGGQRYGKLIQFTDATYAQFSTNPPILFQYTAHTVASGSLELLTPTNNYTADSDSVYFSWNDPARPTAAYDLHIYVDSARTQKVTGTDGGIFDTDHIGEATSHTFSHDPSDGGRRYGKLIQFTDSSYGEFTGEEILFEYTAYLSETTTSEDYDFVKGKVDVEFNKLKTRYTGTSFNCEDGYFSSSAAIGCMQAYKASNNTAYFDEAIRVTQNWIDSGTDLDSDGYLDWYAGPSTGGTDRWNKDHYEWRAASGVAEVLTEMISSGYNGGDSGRPAEYATFLKHNLWDKWAPGHSLQASNTDSSTYLSNRADLSVGNQGRLMLTAIALDKAQAAGLIPASSQYRDSFMTSGTYIGQFVDLYLDDYGEGAPTIHYWYNGGGRHWDTSHAADAIYAMLRAAQLGYDINGKMDLFLAHLKNHFDTVWFPTAAGFTANANGTGNVNQWHDSGSRGMSLSAAYSADLKARFVESTRNHKPTWTFYSETGNNMVDALHYGGCLMWALAGNTL